MKRVQILDDTRNRIKLGITTGSDPSETCSFYAEITGPHGHSGDVRNWSIQYSRTNERGHLFKTSYQWGGKTKTEAIATAALNLTNPDCNGPWYEQAERIAV